MTAPRLLAALCALSLVAAAPLVDPVLARDGHDADEPVAKGRDLELTREDYGAWLVDRVGTEHIHDFLAETLAAREAEELGLAPTREDIEETFLAERDITVDNYYRGDLSKWEDDLRAKGYDVDNWIARRKQRMFFELCIVNLARRDRVITQEELDQRFSDVFGDFGERTTLEVLFFSMYRDVEPGERPDLEALRGESLERAQAAVDALRAGRTVADLLPTADEPNSDFVVDGRIDTYRRRLLGKEVERAQASLDDPGQVSEPVSVFDGYYVVRLVERVPVTLDEVRPELEEIIRESPPNASEIVTTRDRLVAEAEAEVLIK